MHRLTHSFLTLMIAVMALSASAQIRTPAPSPLSKVEQRIGLTDFVVTYSRPSAKGREVYGNVVPFDALWRTGANAATKISFGDDITIGGQKALKGEYALYTMPGKKEWSVMLYKDLALGGNTADYDQSKELLRFKVPAEKLPMKFETLTITFGDLTPNSGNLYIMWEETVVKIPVSVEVDSRVVADIERVMKGPSANDYAQAAGYYLDTDRDLNQALAWMNKALEGNERYWLVTQKARILGKMKNYAEAIKTSERAIELAKADKDDNYIRMNKEYIAEWKKAM
ncbi:MAG: DUF2911 domain-containing protein [Bacteroidetes bacterium]|nr:MAG: DUF2911 domain-containing protein [Bacteroidota bacterium]